MRASGHGLVEVSREEFIAEVEVENGDTVEVDRLRLRVIIYMKM